MYFPIIISPRVVLLSIIIDFKNVINLNNKYRYHYNRMKVVAQPYEYKAWLPSCQLQQVSVTHEENCISK